MTAQQLAFSLLEEKRGVHLLLWEEQGELMRVLLILCASLGDKPARSVLLATDQEAEQFRAEVASRLTSDSADNGSNPFWFIFLQQASAKNIGPWLNGWRRPLSEPPGTLLIVRAADALAFLRAAPDLASFIGPRVHDAETMLSIVTSELAGSMTTRLPGELTAILTKLPGVSPTSEELELWVKGLAN